MTKWPLFLGFKVPSNPPSDLLARHHPPLCVLNSWQIPYFPDSGSDPTLNSCFWPLHLFLPSIWTHVCIVLIFKTLNKRMGFPMISLHHLDGKLWKNVESLEAFIHDQHFFLNCVPLTLQEGQKQERQRVNTFCKAKAQWAWNSTPRVSGVRIKSKLVSSAKEKLSAPPASCPAGTGSTLWEAPLFLETQFCKEDGLHYSSHSSHRCSGTPGMSVSVCKAEQAKSSRSITHNRNVNCAIDFWLHLYCLFNFIFFAGNFLIKNPVIEKPTSQVTLMRPEEAQSLNLQAVPSSTLHPPPARVQNPKRLHFQARVNACDLQLYGGSPTLINFAMLSH